MIMNGWKTWVAGACMAGMGVVAIANGETESGVQQVVAALALVGIGHKIQKLTNK